MVTSARYSARPALRTAVASGTLDLIRSSSRRFAIRALTLSVWILLLVSPPLAAAEGVHESGDRFITSIDRMMVELAPQSARASATIKQMYRRHLDLFVLDEYRALEGALANGGLVPLPPDLERLNLRPRVEGPSPIGEKDLDNQASYISARPAAIGALIEIASRVQSGPLEITSLVRHTEYQGALRRTNGNANTSVPMHTMGLAFDIALINTPLETVYEIRDVLREMQRAGDLLVIGERQQLVFHVVPHPSRLGHFADVYAAAMAEAIPGANVIAAQSPGVTCEIIEVRPTDGDAEEWWATAGVESDLTIEVKPLAAASVAPVASVDPGGGNLAARCLTAITGLFRSACAIFA